MLVRMRVYHFLNRKYGLQNLHRRRLKIATINALNDPFEMIAAASPNVGVRAALLKTKDEMDARAGLLCFSRDWHNSVQWAHYADAHRGICLGFDVRDECVKAVHYQHDRLRIDPAVIEAEGPEAEVFMQALISTKSSHWRYENEFRAFLDLDEPDPETGLFFADFSDNLVLGEAIVGHCSTISRSELADALGDLAPTVKIRKARLAFRTFRVVTQRRADMWR